MIPQGIYHIYADECAAPVVCVTNHGHNGFKSTAMAIEEMSNLTIDGCGSRFVLHGAMDFAIIRGSKNITVRNLTVTCADTCNFQGKVTGAENGNVTIALEEHPPLILHGDALVQTFGSQWEPMVRTLDYVTETGELRRGTGDVHFGVPFQQIKKVLDGDVLYLYDVPDMPEVGDTIVFMMPRRCNQAFLLDHSENILLENVTVHTCWGMAVVAQKCKNVTVRACKVTPEDGRCWSAGQDATHFVNCRGKITIEDCCFENQLDDAANLHGIYTLIEKVIGNRILVRYAHAQTRGIDIYDVGDHIQMMDRETQQPSAFANVAEVEILNPDLTILTLSDVEGEITPGMIVESLSDQADALICNNIIRNNRARGMLVAVKGRVEIAGNHFHSGGAAIQFESDPLKWFESGSVRDVLIADNFFDDCRHGKWCRAVIDINKRPKTVEDFYYHDTIVIRNNRFTQCEAPCVWADNVKNLVFEENEYICSIPFKAEHCIVNGEKAD
ncbi:MAG: right-handed parallel beta-helix repeat-containing protein [Lachnospiraceae bacterium]|nr:right-handed parallel beta-helix repeat-containing protein [Lachnospiraceae bacterium]